MANSAASCERSAALRQSNRPSSPDDCPLSSRAASAPASVRHTIRLRLSSSRVLRSMYPAASRRLSVSPRDWGRMPSISAISR